MEVDKAKENGLEFTVVPSSGLAVYELKIPLFPKKAEPLAVGAKPGATTGTGFETLKFDLSNMQRGGRGGMPGGEMGRPPMGGGGAGFGMGPRVPIRSPILISQKIMQHNGHYFRIKII